MENQNPLGNQKHLLCQQQY
jgi:hypothetical protein